MTRRRTLLLAIVFTSVFLLLAYLVHAGSTLAFDRHVLFAIHAHESDWGNSFFRTVTVLGAWPVVIAVSGILSFAFVLRRKARIALIIALGISGSLVLNVALKGLLDRARPELWVHLVQESSLSFPSGHATASAALGLLAIYVARHTTWRRRVTAMAGVYIACIALSRMYLGVHYPSDILGGWLLAASWIMLMVYCSHAGKNTQLAPRTS